ncbi:hypothetical protein MKX01_027523 [Papaver californicum]|nr:hypothetical protein MKX01_027523 [Papaver californicum]
MVHGSPDDFCEMQTKPQPMPPIFLGNPVILPWQSHPAMPKAIQDMKENLIRRIPEWPVSKIEELNTLLLTVANSKEEYEDLYTLDQRVIMYNNMRPARSLEEFDATDMYDRAMLGVPSRYNFGFIRKFLLQKCRETIYLSSWLIRMMSQTDGLVPNARTATTTLRQTGSSVNPCGPTFFSLGCFNIKLGSDIWTPSIHL